MFLKRTTIIVIQRRLEISLDSEKAKENSPQEATHFPS